jgi:hypothetical protein
MFGGEREGGREIDIYRERYIGREIYRESG